MINNVVTVMIPCFNGEKYLHTCFRCLLNQTYSNVQLIIINDGSTDSSENIILSYKKDIQDKGWEFLYLKQENQGAAQAINNGLKHAKGEFLMLYDVDDIIYENNISAKVEVLKSNNSIGVVINNGYYLNEITGVKTKFVNDKSYINEHGLFNSILFEHAYNWAGCYLVRTEILFQHIQAKNIYVSPYGQNLQIILPVSYFYDYEIIEEPLMEYLTRSNSVSHTNAILKQLELQKGFTKNRIETVNRLDIDEITKNNIIDSIEIWNAKKCFIFAFNNTLKDELKKNKKILVEKHSYSSKDRIRYIVGRNKYLKYFYDYLHNMKLRRKS